MCLSSVSEPRRNEKMYFFYSLHISGSVYQNTQFWKCTLCDVTKVIHTSLRPPQASDNTPSQVTVLSSETALCCLLERS